MTTKENKKEEVQKIKMELEYQSTFAIFEKMERIAIAFALAGRYVNIGRDGDTYTLSVYVIARK